MHAISRLQKQNFKKAQKTKESEVLQKLISENFASLVSYEFSTVKLCKSRALY